MWHENTRNRLMQFDIHSMASKAADFIRAILTIDSLGFDSDYISERYLLTTTFDGNSLRTAGTSYRALIIPGDCRMSEALARHLQNLEAQGARIIRQLNTEALQQAARPEAMKTRLGLKLIRRRNGNTYHYFIANLTPNDIDAAVPLAVDFRLASWINPIASNEHQAAEIHDGQLHIKLRSGESRLLQVSQQSAPSSESTTLPSVPIGLANGISLDRTWRLSFIDSTPTITQTFTLDSLRTWEGLNAQTAELMGTGVYECTFKMDSEAQAQQLWQLDLGDVRESARVSVNDVEIGCAWAVPYVLDVPRGVLRKGENRLRIEVTNLPANRIAALDRQQVPWRKFEDINVVDINYRRTSYANWTPMPSGLIGPVRLIPHSL